MFAVRAGFQLLIIVTLIEQSKDAALPDAETAVQQETEKGKLHGHQHTGEQQHGPGAAQPDEGRCTVQQSRSAKIKNKRSCQNPEVPAHQYGQQPEELPFDIEKAFPYCLGQIFALQCEQGQYHRQEQRQQKQCGQNDAVQSQIERLCPDQAHKIGRDSQLGDVAGSDENIGKGNQEDAVHQ